jgi:hypothetical protein
LKNGKGDWIHQQISAGDLGGPSQPLQFVNPVHLGIQLIYNARGMLAQKILVEQLLTNAFVELVLQQRRG